LWDEKKCQVVLIPFNISEDLKVIEELERRLSNKVFVVKHKYLTNEMLSLIGNRMFWWEFDFTPSYTRSDYGSQTIGISYDPKINAFMGSIRD
jgi:polysaccharide pyruvyl transferase WcaK-like protein